MAYPSKLGRPAIASVGMRLLARKGLHGLSLRAIAKDLNVAPNALYHHIPDRSALESLLAAEVSGLLHAAFNRAMNRTQSPEEAVRTLAVAYMAFAREHRLLFEALLVPRPESGLDLAAPQQLWLYVVEVVKRVTGEGEAHKATVALWAFLHGMASLQSVDAFSDEKPLSSFEFGLNAWIVAARDAKSIAAGVCRPTVGSRKRTKGTYIGRRPASLNNIVRGRRLRS